MAKSASFNKRDNEKKKLSKRLEKQQRKEERNSTSKGGSLEDMLAYVDENGVITTTPPDTGKKKEEIDAESIAISTPKRGEIEEEAAHEGRVEYFNSSKGYGFIKDRGNTDKYFFHKSNAPQDIGEGDTVFFDLEQGNRGINAINIRFVKEPGQAPLD
jgi:cold shock CspA family protein